ncbi:hypothetical protein [Xanthomonas arboricola]|uniref:hypothetical protein n=1 Tax=Xanthomonas arboricola TaxID=56448 RepID=UPI0015E3164C|nr:hypothetical protein [Xanthomonas arboricola]
MVDTYVDAQRPQTVGPALLLYELGVTAVSSNCDAGSDGNTNKKRPFAGPFFIARAAA